MKKFKFLFGSLAVILATLFIYSCAKEEMLLKTTIATRSNYSDGPSNDCFSGIPTEFRNENYTFFIRKLYEKRLISNPSFIRDGRPDFEGTITLNEDQEFTSVTPLLNQSNDSVVSLFND
jgi:hypothetical protein